MVTTPKRMPSRKLSKRPLAEKLAQDLSGLVEKRFAEMSSREWTKKHEEFISALKGRKP